MLGGSKRAKQNPLVFLVTEVTSSGRRINIYGRERGTAKSVYAYTDSFYPYFYAESLLDNLESRIVKKNPGERAIVSIELVQRTSVMGYHPEGASDFYKITFETPALMKTCQNVLEHKGINTYEASIQHVVRFMADNRFGGHDWLQLDSYRVPENSSSRTDIEIEFKNVLKRDDLDDFAEMRILSFDIEACKDGRGFVDPKQPNDVVSQIGLTLFDGNYQILDKRVLCLGPGLAKLPDGIAGEVFPKETALLIRFRDYVREKDPDMFTGYNIDGFDWWYLFERAKTLRIRDEFAQMSRLYDRPASLRNASFSSRAKGARKDYEARIEGRFGFDMYKFMQDTVSVRSYQLGSISQDYLGESKVEMPYEDIPVYQAGTDEQRAHLSYYCWWDADLCRRLMKARMCIVNNVETSRVCGVPMKFLMTRGQQVLSTRLFLEAANRRGFILPSSTENQNDEKTKGATVLVPKIGFYRVPIATLDFQSLYPSIMRDKNICYSSKAPKSYLERTFKPEDYFIPPVPGCTYGYVKEHIHQGILSEIEESLFNRRLAAKADLKAEKDPAKKEVLNGRQLAIKVRMNSLYGYTKANTLCDKDLMETITGIGRYMIETTKAVIEARYEGSEIIYGDTDSVFVSFGDLTPEEIFRVATEAASICTDIFNEERKAAGLPPIHLLQMEKIFFFLLLVGKKKYAGFKQLTLTSKPLFDSSGLETVRRDNALVASEALDRCLQMMLVEGKTPEEAIAYVHRVIGDLLMGRIEINKLIISKNLSKTFEAYEQSGSSLPHVTLAKKIAARSHVTGEKLYHTGDRVKYVLVKGVRNAKSSDCAEDPLYVMENRLPIDFSYYIENQLMKPLLRIFTPILAPGENLKKTNKKGDSVYINDGEMRQLTAYKRLFTGPHMLQKVQRVKEGATGIMKFAKILPTCVSCGCSSPKGICSSCEPKKQLIYLSLMEQSKELELRRWAAWTRCQQCVGDKHTQKISCRNKDCDNFYQREKVVIDIEDLAGKFDKLS